MAIKTRKPRTALPSSPGSLSDSHFRDFTKNLETILATYGKHNADQLLALQKEQVEGLVALEDEFRRELIKHSWGMQVYGAFCSYICDQRRNILAARPFFRERQPVFTAKISKALKNRDLESLSAFRINYPFIAFVLKAKKWPKKGKINVIANKIKRIRMDLVEMNLPLAISRAKMFYNKTPKAQLAYMDFVQISAEGLIAAVDKFVPPFSRVFRAVAIGRMLGNFIEEYSETLVHFYPLDRRKLYRANKVAGKQNFGVDYDKLTAEVNVDMERNQHTSPVEIAELMAAASTISLETPAVQNSSSTGRVDTIMDVTASPETKKPDKIVEAQELNSVIYEAIGNLTLFEQKLLKLKGIPF